MRDLVELPAQFYTHLHTLGFPDESLALNRFNACLLINSIECIGMVSGKWPYSMSID
jgi:hypothetical protein